MHRHLLRQLVWLQNTRRASPARVRTVSAQISITWDSVDALDIRLEGPDWSFSYTHLEDILQMISY